jgi:hypothetical protein
MELAGKGNIVPEKLPPTAETAHHHGLRVHHQIMTWLLLEESLLFDPLDWGWECNAGTLVPVTTPLDFAPSSLKNMIRCKCKITTKHPCGTKLCTCYKYGLPCLPSCEGCRGEECNNTKRSICPDEDNSPGEDNNSIDMSGRQELDNIFDILNSEFNDENDF